MQIRAIRRTGAICAGLAITLLRSGCGPMFGWGQNLYGYLGDSTTTDRTQPTASVAAPANVKAIDAGSLHSCAVSTNGGLWCAGNNSDGQLGDGTITNRTAGVAVGTATDWVTVTGGSHHTCGIRAPGSLWCWGANLAGELGDGTHTERRRPRRIGVGYGLGDRQRGRDPDVWRQAVGIAVVLGRQLLRPRSVTGRPMSDVVPTRVGSDSTWKSVSAGTFNACGARTDGTLWCWGGGAEGQLGDGTTDGHSAPGQVHGGQLGGGERRELDDVCAPHDRDALVLGREQPRHRRRRIGLRAAFPHPGRHRHGLDCRCRRLRARVRCARRRAAGAGGATPPVSSATTVIDLRLSPARVGTATDWSLGRRAAGTSRSAPAGRQTRRTRYGSDARAGPRGATGRVAGWRVARSGATPRPTCSGARGFVASAARRRASLGLRAPRSRRRSPRRAPAAEAWPSACIRAARCRACGRAAARASCAASRAPARASCACRADR